LLRSCYAIGKCIAAGQLDISDLHFVSFAFASEICGDVYYLMVPTAMGPDDDTPEEGEQLRGSGYSTTCSVLDRADHE
jgi:hypothetical protein